MKAQNPDQFKQRMATDDVLVAEAERLFGRSFMSLSDDEVNVAIDRLNARPVDPAPAAFQTVEVAYTTADRNNRIVSKRKVVRTQAAMDRLVENAIEIVATSTDF